MLEKKKTVVLDYFSSHDGNTDFFIPVQNIQFQ